MEGAVTVESVWSWLQKVPGFAEEMGIESISDLQYLGSGGRAEVVYLGERDGLRLVLKVTKSAAQAGLSRLAMEQQPPHIVPVHRVIETTGAPRGLPELPRRGEEARYETRRWGIVEDLAVPVPDLPRLRGMRIGDEPVQELYDRFCSVDASVRFDADLSGSAEEDWAEAMRFAISWIHDACVEASLSPSLDLHDGNWGVHPDTGELLLIDLGQCYEP